MGVEETDASVEDALRREVHEELGGAIRIPQLVTSLSVVPLGEAWASALGAGDAAKVTQ
ncbi:NUDIX domain-containing protein [Streptomyces sp. CBMA123]|uniref:NUDIX domain-containing protein n=1 Tax=Streptomyces sp. CBMA123 TaxID=1896313 RepID=UPI003983BA13